MARDEILNRIKLWSGIHVGPGSSLLIIYFKTYTPKKTKSLYSLNLLRIIQSSKDYNPQNNLKLYFISINP